MLQDAGQILPTVLTFKWVNKKQELAGSLPQCQTYTLTGSRQTLARTYSASLSEGKSLNTELQGRSNYIQMKAELNAASLSASDYCWK